MNTDEDCSEIHNASVFYGSSCCLLIHMLCRVSYLISLFNFHFILMEKHCSVMGSKVILVTSKMHIT